MIRRRRRTSLAVKVFVEAWRTPVIAVDHDASGLEVARHWRMQRDLARRAPSVLNHDSPRKQETDLFGEAAFCVAGSAELIQGGL